MKGKSKHYFVRRGYFADMHDAFRKPADESMVIDCLRGSGKTIHSIYKRKINNITEWIEQSKKKESKTRNTEVSTRKLLNASKVRDSCKLCVLMFCYFKLKHSSYSKLDFHICIRVTFQEKDSNCCLSQLFKSGHLLLSSVCHFNMSSF